MKLSPRGRCLFCCRGGLFKKPGVWWQAQHWDQRLPPNTHFDRGPIMIALTRLNGQQFVINAEKIRYLESTPDTLVCCDTGEKLMVKESLQEVIRRAIDYARTIRRPIAD